LFPNKVGEEHITQGCVGYIASPCPNRGADQIGPPLACDDAMGMREKDELVNEAVQSPNKVWLPNHDWFAGFILNCRLDLITRAVSKGKDCNSLVAPSPILEKLLKPLTRAECFAAAG
jgi:hypothetical protein